MSARSIDPSSSWPSGVTSVAPTTSLLLPLLKPTQMSTDPLLAAPFESQPVAVTLPRMQGCAAAVKPSGKTTGSPLAAGDPLAPGDPLASALGDGVGASVATAVADGDGEVVRADLRVTAEDAGQHRAAEQRQHAEREEAEDGDRTEAGAALARLLPVVVRVARSRPGRRRRRRSCRRTPAGTHRDRHVRWRRRPRVGRRRCGGGRRGRCRPRPLVAVAGDVRRAATRRRRSGRALVEIVLARLLSRVRPPGLGVGRIGLVALVSAGLVVDHPAATVRVAPDLSGADAVLELVAIHAARTGAGVGGNRRAALGAEAGGRGRAMTGRATDLARLGGRHIPRIVHVMAGACTRRGAPTSRSSACARRARPMPGWPRSRRRAASTRCRRRSARASRSAAAP